MQRLSQILPQLAKDRHFQISSTNEKTQRYFEKSGFSRAPQSSESSPSLGIYVNQQNSSKLDWYTRRKTVVTQIPCDKDGIKKYHVKFTLTNTLTNAEFPKLPSYITGNNHIPHGQSTEKVLIYAPLGGSLSDLKTTGKVTAPKIMTLNDKSLRMSVASLKPEETATYEFDVTTSSKTTSNLIIDQTPSVLPESGIEYH
jgi:hypothetical protein